SSCAISTKIRGATSLTARVERSSGQRVAIGRRAIGAGATTAVCPPWQAARPSQSVEIGRNARANGFIRILCRRTAAAFPLARGVGDYFFDLALSPPLGRWSGTRSGLDQ